MSKSEELFKVLWDAADVMRQKCLQMYIQFTKTAPRL